MKNADMPAYPLSDERLVELLGDDYNAAALLTRELTKRELFAMTTLQGLLVEGWSYHEVGFLTAKAVEYADSLIKALEDTNEK